MHNISSLYMRVTKPPQTLRGHIKHGNRTIVVVEQGYVGYATDNGQPVLLPPGIHVWTSESLDFVAVGGGEHDGEEGSPRSRASQRAGKGGGVVRAGGFGRRHARTATRGGGRVWHVARRAAGAVARAPSRPSLRWGATGRR